MIGRATSCRECRRRHKGCKVNGVAVPRMEAQPRRAQGQKRKRTEADPEGAAEARQARPKRKRARRVVTSESEVESDRLGERWVPAPTGRLIPYVLVPPRATRPEAEVPRMRPEAEAPRMRPEAEVPTTRPEGDISIWGMLEQEWKKMKKRVTELEGERDQLKERVTELEGERDEMRERMDRLEAKWRG